MHPGTDALWAEFGEAESGTVDFKESLPRAAKLQEPLVAMANSYGGSVVVGVSDALPRRVPGVTRSQAFEERVQEAARATQPPLDVGCTWRTVRGREVTQVAVIAVQAVTDGFVQTSDGRLLVRAGPTNRTLLGTELARFVTERGSRPAEDHTVAGATLESLDRTAVLDYVRRRMGVKRTPFSQAVRDLGLVDPTGEVRLASLLLFGKSPQAEHRRLGIDVLRFEGAVDARDHVLRDKAALTGTLPDMVAAADASIYDQMRRDSVIRGLVREEVPEYPTIAIREALLNAVGHRDYSMLGSAVQVRLFDDAVEIESPGTLAGYVTVENLRDSQYSRNIRIMEVFQVLGLVEEAGSGIDRMFDALDDALLQEPIFREGTHSFLVRFRGQSVFSADDRLWVEQFRDERLPANAKVALVFARNQGSVSNEDMRRLRNLESRPARKLLQGLVARGLLHVDGVGRGTRYALAPRARSLATPRRERRISAVVDHAGRTGFVTNAAVRGLLGVTRAEALALLEGAVNDGKLRPVGERRARRYIPVRRE